MSESNKLPESVEKTATKFDSLSENIQSLTKQLEKREIARKQRKIRKRQQLNDLYDSIEEKSNAVVSKLEDLSRKPTIVISVSKILPEIPQNFPKNYNIQIVYEDVTVSGNQKFVDFDQNIVDERFILPLLSSQNAKLEIWIAQQEPSLYDRSIINLQSDIQAAIEDANYSTEINLETNSSLSVSYNVQLQGIGFSAWLKNIRSFREAEQERKKQKKQREVKQIKTRQIIEEKKNKFNSKFVEKQNASSKTKEYDLKGIEEILNILDD